MVFRVVLERGGESAGGAGGFEEKIAGGIVAVAGDLVLNADGAGVIKATFLGAADVLGLGGGVGAEAEEVAPGGVAGVKGQAGSYYGGGIAAGPTILASRNPISTLQGGSLTFSAAGGATLGAGASVSTSGAVTITFGVGAGAEAGITGQIGTSQFMLICK
jgi:hypothetical protein